MDSSSQSSSSSESEAESIEDDNPIVRRPRVFRERVNQFEKYDDIDFQTRFRFTKETVLHILEIIGPEIERRTRRSHPVPAIIQLLVTLRFYATGSFQKVLADHIDISQPTVCRIIPRVTNAIAALRPDYIKMPTTLEERRRTMARFHAIRGFPCVIGAIDCTHIKIQSPGGPFAELYRNRKGWFSYNVQAVCDADLKFTNLIARRPGSVHDSTIFNDSPLRIEFENGDYPDCYLLGDSGYPCKPFLLTPLNNPNTPAGQNYNVAHIETRNPIERSYGVWKRVFPCLSLGMRLKKQTVLHVIVATAVLHNLRIDMRDPEPIDDDDIGDDIDFEFDDDDIVDAAVDMVHVEQPNRANNFEVRNAVIEAVFNR